MALTPCADVSAADWLVDSEQPWHQLVGFGPSGFPAYARVRFLPDPAYQGQSENDVSLRADAPTETEQLRIVLDTLGRCTRTPDECYFCLWDGWASDVEGGVFPRSVVDGPKVVVPNRAYYLFRGTLTDFGDWGAAGMWPGQPRRHVPDPAFVWPADRTWCVADDVDPHWAGIGADRSAIDQLVADPCLDVVRADPRATQPHYL